MAYEYQKLPLPAKGPTKSDLFRKCKSLPVFFSCKSESAFSILNNTFKLSQNSALKVYVETAVILQYNKQTC